LRQARAIIGQGYLEDTEGKCDICIQGKITRTPKPKYSGIRSETIFGRIHMDLMGPMRTTSAGGMKYILLIVDDYSRMIFCYFLANKSDTFAKFEEFYKLAQKQSRAPTCINIGFVESSEEDTVTGGITITRSDYGGEFIGKKWDEFMARNGIRREFSVTNNPHQNGVAERANRTVVEMARTMLIGAHMPANFWAEAVNTAVYIRNRVVSTATNGKTPHELFFREKPPLNHLKEFGCVAYVYVEKKDRDKFDAKAIEGCFFGYAENRKCYRIYVPGAEKVILTRDVAF
jgi:transposase InsO family protein